MGKIDLGGIPLFAGLVSEDRARVAAVARRLHWAVGQVVLGEGEFAFDFYAITHGAAEVRHGARRVATLGDGDFFGEIGLVGQSAGNAARRRSATVIVTAPTEAVAIAGSDLRGLAQEIPMLREALDRAAAEREQT